MHQRGGAFRTSFPSMVAAFEGTISEDEGPRWAKLCAFLPEHCMMQNVHSGVVVHSEGNKVRI